VPGVYPKANYSLFYPKIEVMILKSILFFPFLLCTFVMVAQEVNDPVTGSQQLAIVPFDYASDSSHQSIDDITTGFFTSPFSIKSFIEEISYGKATIGGTVYDYRRNQPPLFGQGYTNCFPVDDVIANQPDVDYSIIDNIVLMVHDTVSKSCAAGNSSFGKLPFSTSDGNYSFRRSGFRTQFYTPHEFSGISNSTVAHELMHSFGISYHSNSYILKDGEFEIQAYGNLFDIMGLRSQASHPCALIKEQKGWLTDNEIRRIQGSDTVRIYPLEKTLPGQTQCVVIELPNDLDLQPNDDLSFSKIYIEYRGLTGFDQRTIRRVRLNDGSNYTIENPHGALVYGIDCQLNDDFCLPVLLDMHPEPMGGVGASYTPHEASDAPLLIDESYSVPNTNVTIEVTEVVPGEYIEVSIGMGVVSAADEKPLSNLRVYPNPASDRLYISGAEGAQIQTNIYNTHGKRVLSNNNARHIDISTLQTGTYIVELHHLIKGKRSVQKIVVSP
jgi:hypothetical protein